MTEDDADSALDICDEMLARAFDIVSNAPYWKRYVAEKEFAKIDVDGETATLTWPESVGGYEGEHHIEAESVSFPASLLYLNDGELASWKQEQRVLYEQRERQRQLDLAQERENQERATYNALKAKFG